MIKFESIKKSFKEDFWKKGNVVLENVNFEIKKGEIVGFLGANGAGKTTSLKIMMGFIEADEGKVTFDKSLGINHNEIMAKIGYLPERPYFYPHLTAREFTKYVSTLADVSQSVFDLRLDKWSKIFKIDFALDRKLSGFSKGMLQRIGFVTTLIHNPEIVILDEPLAGLDPMGRKEIKDVMLSLKKEGKTIFFSSHIVSDVEEVCNEVIVLEKGHIVYEGSIDQLIRKNLHPNYRIKLINDNVISLKNKYKSQEQTEDEIIFEVDVIKKNDFLVEALENKNEILSVEQDRPSLEEIVYKIRENNDLGY